LDANLLVLYEDTVIISEEVLQICNHSSFRIEFHWANLYPTMEASYILSRSKSFVLHAILKFWEMTYFPHGSL
jgi:hypothetical protein